MKYKLIMRFAGCAALLALLAVSSYAGRKQIEVPAAAVMFETVSRQELSAYSMVQTSNQLKSRREESLEKLESVLSDPRADEQVRTQALLEKTQLAVRMEMEAEVEALLAHMGFDQTAVIMGNQQMSIIAPWQTAENEKNRVTMIDAAAGHSGLSADAIKIILAKNE